MLVKFDRAQQRIVDDRGERNYEGAGEVRIFREFLYHRLVLGPRRSEDVKICQHLRSVDADIEGARNHQWKRMFRQNVALSCGSIQGQSQQACRYNYPGQHPDTRPSARHS